MLMRLVRELTLSLWFIAHEVLSACCICFEKNALVIFDLIKELYLHEFENIDEHSLLLEATSYENNLMVLF